MAERVYIFLTNKIGGVSGGVRYVSNKCQWLERHGWIVDVYDTTGQDNAPIQLPYLEKYKKNRIREFFYYPSWFSEKTRNKLIKRVCSKYLSDNNKKHIVVESNTNTTAVWAELVAQSIGARHIVYLIGENIVVNNKTEFDFFNYKIQNDDFYTINSNAFSSIFRNYRIDASPQNYVWNANVDAPVEDVALELLDNLPPADTNVGHFGRKKGYFQYMVDEIIRFANNNSTLTINLIFLGIDNLEIPNLPQNIRLLNLGSMMVLPKKYFRICDCIIAVAGCASIAYEQGSKVITFDVNSNKPLGVLGYTTVNRVYRSNESEKDLSDILKDCIVELKYDGKKTLEIPGKSYGLEFQEQCACKQMHNKYYPNMNGVEGGVSAHDAVLKVLLKFGLVSFASVIRYYNFKRITK